jgi:hypothetical protein
MIITSQTMTMAMNLIGLRSIARSMHTGYFELHVNLCSGRSVYSLISKGIFRLILIRMLSQSIEQDKAEDAEGPISSH